MFESTVTFSEFRKNLKAHMEKVLLRDQAIQIIHVKNPIRVLITQDTYLALKQQIYLYEIELGLADPTASVGYRSQADDLKMLKKRQLDLDARETASDEMLNEELAHG